MTYFLSRIGDHRFDRRSSYCTARSLCDYQRRCLRPVARQRERRNCQHVNGVTDKGDDPVFVCLVRDKAGDRTESIAQQLTESDYKSNHSRAGAERTHEGANDAARAFVSEIGEQVDDANDENKAKS